MPTNGPKCTACPKCAAETEATLLDSETGADDYGEPYTTDAWEYECDECGKCWDECETISEREMWNLSAEDDAVDWDFDGY